MFNFDILVLLHCAIIVGGVEVDPADSFGSVLIYLRRETSKQKINENNGRKSQNESMNRETLAKSIERMAASSVGSSCSLQHSFVVVQNRCQDCADAYTKLNQQFSKDSIHFFVE